MLLGRKRIERERLLDEFGNLKNHDFNFESIEKYFTGQKKSHPYQLISNKTCNDLDVNELFMFVDRSTSPVGQQFLYNQLRNIPEKNSEVSKNEDLVEKFTTDEDFRILAQSSLLKLTRTESYYISTLFQEEHLKPPKWFFVFRLLSFTMLLSILLIPFNPNLLILIIMVFLVNLVLHYRNKRNLYQYLGSLPILLVLNDVAKKLFEIDGFKKIDQDLLKSTAEIDKVRNHMSFFKLEANLQNDAAAIFWSFLEILKIAFLLEPLLLFSAIKRLDTKREQIEKIFRFVGTIDMLISVSSLRKGLGKYCIPKINDEAKSIRTENIYHPLIANCVKNSIDTIGKSILLTGSNMSGKTSFIRTVGVNVLCGLTLNTCFADEFEMPPLRIFSAIRISDDLLNDKSYYFEEVLTVKQMIDRSVDSNRNLFLLDEIFKGTNTVERIAAGKAVLSALSKTGSIVFVSTHDIELADLLKDEFELYHFSEIVDESTVAFDYKLKEGKLKNRNAIRILEINNYPKEVIQEAIKISKEI